MNVQTAANNNDPPSVVPSTTSPGRSTQQAKRILLFCWLIAVTHIWLASDDTSLSSFDNAADRESFDLQMEERMRLEGYAPPNTPIDSRRETIMDDDDRSQNNQGPLLKEDTGAGATTRKLPEALAPITHDDCCVPAIYSDYGRPNDMKCFGTCYNERVCHDPSYPYKDMEEQRKYGHLQKLDGRDTKSNLRQRCVYNPEYLVPNVTWCFNTNNYSVNSSSVYGDVAEPGCSLVSNGGGSGPWQNVLLFPRAKLAFCGIPKVGITQWIQFARFVAGAKDYPSLPHYKLDTDYLRFDKLNASIQEEIWLSKDWTWSVFLRDPAERLLSAYLDKVLKQSTQEKILNALGRNLTRGFTFEDFVERLGVEFDKAGCKTAGEKNDKNASALSGMTGLNWCSDPRK